MAEALVNFFLGGKVLFIIPPPSNGFFGGEGEIIHPYPPPKQKMIFETWKVQLVAEALAKNFFGGKGGCIINPPPPPEQKMTFDWNL